MSNEWFYNSQAEVWITTSNNFRAMVYHVQTRDRWIGHITYKDQKYTSVTASSKDLAMQMVADKIQQAIELGYT